MTLASLPEQPTSLAARSEARRRYLAIALCSAAVILLQIAVTRILSVVVWYHWAFFSISLAMLGVGAPGVWFALRRPQSPHTLKALLLAAAVQLPASTIAIVKASHLFGTSTILFCMSCLLPPVLLLGAAVCFLLMEAEGAAIARMYAFDLLGAFVGALLVIPLLWTVPTPILAGCLGLLPLTAYLVMGGSRWAALGAALALLALVVWGEPFKLRHSKSYAETDGTTRPFLERWTPTARLTIFDTIFFADPRHVFGWGMGSRSPAQAPPRQLWIEQDGSAGTPITSFDGDTSKLAYLLSDVTSVGYQLRPPKNAAVVGAGGGRDVLTALTAGTKQITAIELNPATVELLRTRFGEFTGHLYDDPRVNMVIGEGRSELTRTRDKFDLIQISLIDSWAATSAGAFALSENNLYTVEAYRQYFSRLTEHGLVSTSRWMMGGMGLEVPRLLFVVKAALAAEGIQDPMRHIVLMQGGAVGNVLMLRSPLTNPELERLKALAIERGFVLHLPDSALAPHDRWVRGIIDQKPEAFLAQGLRLEPVNDDRPFFFQTLSPFSRVTPEIARAYGTNGEGVVALQKLMIAMAGITVLLFFAPFLLGRWLKPAPGFWRGSLFFTAIGLAFMLVEVAWLSRFILYLEHPSLATTVTLGCMLLGAGLGSMVSVRFGLAQVQRWGFAIPLLLLATNLLLRPVFALTLGWPWTLRMFATMLLIVPSGAAMGFCFPLGMLRFGERNKAWFWALNGAAGVFASVLSLALSMELGFSLVASLGAALYVAAWLLLRGRPAAVSASTTPTGVPLAA